MLQQGAIGIDFGSSRSVIAVAKRGGVEVIANEGSHQQTKNIVGYGNEQRFLGAQGEANYKSNFKNSVTFFSRLLGLRADYQDLKEETKWITSPIAVNEKGHLMHKIIYQGEEIQVLPEQVTAAMLQKLRTIMTLNNLENKECVISVPGYYTEQERRALLDAAAIADLKVMRLFNETSAVSLSYGIFRRADLDATTPRNVLFVDLGHSKCSAFVGAFTKTKMKVLTQSHNRNLGARDMDWTLIQTYCDKFKKATGLDPFENKRAILRLIDAVEKQRKVLSSNMESTCSVECIMQEYDIHERLTRDEFQTLIAPILQRFTDFLQTFKAEIEAMKISLHSVEMVGEATRIPIIQQILAQTFNPAPLNRTLDSSSCVAKGCAMMAAILSPLFQVASYAIEEHNYHQINVSWAYDKQNSNEMEKEPKQSKIFDKGCSIPNTKSLTFTKPDPITINLFYSNPPPGFDAHLASFYIPASVPKEPNFSIKVFIELNQNGLVRIKDAVLNEEYIVEEKVPKPKVEQPKQPAEQQPATAANGEQPAEQKTDAPPPQPTAPQEPEFDIVQKKKTRQCELKFEHENKVNCMTQLQITKYLEIEGSQANQDKITFETQMKKNELESLIYNWRENLESQMKQFAHDDVKKIVLEKLDQASAWLQEQDYKTCKSKYEAQIQHINQDIQPILNRYKIYDQIPHYVQMAMQELNTLEKFVYSKEKKYEHIPEVERNKVANLVLETKNWLNQIEQTAKNQSKHLEPPTTLEGIKKKIEDTYKLCNPIINMPVPEPPKPEPKPEANKTEQPKQEENKQPQPETKTQMETEQSNQQPEQKKEPQKMDIEMD